MRHYQFIILSALAVFGNLAGFELALAQQPIYPKRLSSRLIKEARFSELPPPLLALVDSAIKHYDAGDNEGRQKSVQDLQKILTMQEVKKTGSLFQAWVHEWLALSYFVLDSTSLVEQHVKRSLQKNVEIWREYPDFKRLHSDVTDIYQKCWAEIEDRFKKKSHSCRLGVGTITRADYSHRFLEHWDVVAGIGTPTVVVIQPDKPGKSDFKSFKQLLFFTRVQRMRKDIERLTGGVYLEFSLLEDLTKSKIRPAKVFSGGPILSYTYQSGWEVGGAFEIARLAIGGTGTKFSQTAFKGNFTLSYSNFEFYIRKWF